MFGKEGAPVEMLKGWFLAVNPAEPDVDVYGSKSEA